MAPAAIIDLLAGRGSLVRVTVKRIGVVTATSGDTMTVVARQLPAKALRESLSITHGTQEAAVIGIALFPEETAAACSGVPGGTTISRGIGFEEGVFIIVGQARVGELDLRQGRGVGMRRFLACA